MGIVGSETVADLLAAGRFVVLDTETTGVDVEQDRIVAVYAGGPQQARDVDAVIDPGVPIPPAASAIHGITTERARAEGADPAVVLPALAQVLREAWDAGTVVIGFNLSYDLGIVSAELARRSLALGPVGACVDPLVMDRHLDRYRRGRRQLSDVCAVYGVRLEAHEAHGARADALAAGRLAQAMARRHPGAFAVGPQDLQRTQAAAHRAWAENFTRYLTSRGQDASGVNPCWPLRE